MKYFSYNDFMDCTENGEINKAKKVEENLVRYEVKNGIEDKNKNKIIEILKEKMQLRIFLKEFFNLLEIGNIENFSYRNTIKSISDKELNNNIICKINNKEIFIFIKVIENIDNNICYKMFEHSLNIIKKWDLEEKIENKRYPIVIPIAIYTGKDNWKDNYSKIHSRINYIKYEKNRINFSYNLININNLQTQELEKMNSKFAKEILNIKNKVTVHR